LVAVLVNLTKSTFVLAVLATSFALNGDAIFEVCRHY